MIVSSHVPARREETRIRLRLGWLAAMLVAALLAAPGAGAQQAAPTVDPALAEKIRLSNAECYACHSRQTFPSFNKQGVERSRLRHVLMDEPVFKNSNHGGMECKTCHTSGYASFPHADDARSKISPCEECHARNVMRIEGQYDKSVHAQRLGNKFTCVSCHDPHIYRVAAKIGAPQDIVRQDNAMCLDCHRSDLRFAELTADRRRPDLDRAHEFLPSPERHWQAVRCVECHTPLTRGTLSHEVLKKEQAERECVSCHTRDTTLQARLYRHLVTQEQERLGFANSIILSNSYVIGASRNPWIDGGVGVLAALAVGGVAAHGGLRFLMFLLRRRRGK